MIIDYHHHLQGGADYLDRLIATMDASGIEKVCLNGLGIGKGRPVAQLQAFGLGDLSPDNNDVLAAFRAYPDRIIPIGVVRLGTDGPDAVDRMQAQGFRGLKITRPRLNYSDDACMGVYARAESLGLPILFHTGMVLITPFDAEDDVDSLRMRPMALDRAARRFPGLHITLAHMGMPWLEEAACMARFHKNVYLDLTASPLGWRDRLSPADFQRLLYWDEAFDKLIFGTDVSWEGVAGSLASQSGLLDRLGVPEGTKRRFFFENAARALNM
jgi:predicted TIM-barrel fold metal-dependent hydrolase